MNASKKYISKILFLTFFLYPFFPLIKAWNSRVGLVVEAVLLVLLVSDSVLENKKGHIVFVAKKTYVYFVSFLVIYLLINVSNIYSAFSGFRTFVLYLALYQEMKRLEKIDNSMNVIIKTCLFTGLIMGLGCIMQFVMPEVIKGFHNPATWDALRSKTDWTAYGIYNRALSFMTDPNVLSAFLVFVVFIAFEYYSYTKSKTVFITSIIMIVGIILTQSRTGIFALLLYFFISSIDTAFFKNKVTPIKLMIFLFFVLVLGICMLLYWREILSFLRIDTLFDGNGRFLNNAMNLEELLEKPIQLFVGNGMYDGRDIILENSYIGLLHMFGLAGCIIFSILCYQYFREIIIKENLKYIICYSATIFVGDYVLIPQITMIFLALIFINKAYRIE